MDSNNDHQHHHVVKIDSRLHQVRIRTLQGLPQPIEINSLTNHEPNDRINHLVGRMVLMINFVIGIIGVQNLVKGLDLIDQDWIDPLVVGSTDLLELKDRDLMDPDRHVWLAHQEREDSMVHHGKMVQDLEVLQDSMVLDDLMVHKDSMVHPDLTVHQDLMVHLDSMVRQGKMVQEISIHDIIVLPEVEVLDQEVALHTQCEAVSRLGLDKTGLVLADHPLAVGLVASGVVVVVDDFKVLNLLTAL